MMRISSIEEIRNNLKGKEIHIIPYAHPDYAWTHYRQWHVERYILIINEVLDIMKENPEYTWMTDNIKNILEPFFTFCPSRIGEFRQRVKEGRIEITNGIISLIRPTQAGDEAFIRNIVLGKRYCEDMFPDVNINVYNNVDVSAGHSQLPQLLKLAGYEYFWCWRPQGAMDCKGIPGQFVWKGLDETGIVCARGAYNGLCGLDYMNGDLEKDWDDMVRQFHARDLSAAMKRACVPDLWVPNGMDDTRPLRDFTDEPCRLPEFIERWNEKEECRMSFSTTGRYFSKITDAELPVVEGILDGCDVGYNTPQKGDKGLWRVQKELDRLLVKAESLCSMASMVGRDYPQEELNDIWVKFLGVSEHAQESLMDTDFEYVYSTARNAVYNAEEFVRRAQSYIAARVSELPYNTGGSRKQLVLFNTLGWDREEIIPMHIAQPAGGRSFRLVGQDGKDLKYQIIETYKGDVQYRGSWFDEIDILAKVKVPAFGYASLGVIDGESGLEQETFNISADDIDLMVEGAEYQIVDTGTLKVSIREGRITDITDNNGRHIYCFKDCHTPINDIKFTRVWHHENAAWLFFSHIQGVDRFQPHTWKWIEYGPLRWRLAVEGNVGINNVRQEIILYKGRRNIDFSVDIDCCGNQAGYFSAAFPIDEYNCIMADIPFGVEKRNIPDEPYGKVSDNVVDNIERLNKGLFYARSWIDYKYAGRSMSLISESCGNYFLLDDAGPVSIILTKAIDYEKSTDWMKHSHQWTNCKGINNFKYTLYLHEPEDSLYSTTRLAREKANKIDACTKLGDACREAMPLNLSMLDIQGATAVMSSFYKYNDRYILRLYEATGQYSKIKIRSYLKVKSVEPVDFFGNSLDRDEIIVADNGFGLETAMRPWEIVNLAIDFI